MDTTQSFDQPAFDDLAGKEWLVTNGIGGYSSSTICGANTRRYHGLLVAAMQPPTDRRVLVSKVEEKVKTGDGEFWLSTNPYPGVIHPQGYEYLKSFRRQPFPETVFGFEKNTLVKRVWMHYGYNTTVVEYVNPGKETLLLELNPLFVCRDHHQLFHSYGDWPFEVTTLSSQSMKITPAAGQPDIFMRFSTGTFHPHPDWYRNMEYARETERGLDDHEDTRSVGRIVCELIPGAKATLVFSTDVEDMHGAPSVWEADEIKRLAAVGAGIHDAFIRDLAVSGDQFLVRRDSTAGHSMIAGYHWFTDWGRDTMIAMRGLFIATGRREIARSILSTFLKYLDRGMIPNRFPDHGEKPEYNTLDATLWLFVALYEYHEAFGDMDFIAEVFDHLTSILEAHDQGTRYHIHVTPEGLLYGGQDGTQLTWMDAKVGEHVVTPRIGCPVEINALWYNALCIYVHFGKALGRKVTAYEQRAGIFKSIFQKYFYNEKGYLHDVVVPGGSADDAIRPNQLYAVSLPFSPLTPVQARDVLKVVHAHLYTDYGLRSLSPEHPEYKPVFTGDPWQRDHAYHQGTVWAFLWGEYALAHLNVYGGSPEARQWVKEHVETLKYHFYNENGLYAISENFDGDRPGAGKGCIQQAWSVGMTLLALKKIDIL